MTAESSAAPAATVTVIPLYPSKWSSGPDSFPVPAKSAAGNNELSARTTAEIITEMFD